MYYYLNEKVVDLISVNGRPEYRYIWSAVHGAFLRYTDCVYDPHDAYPGIGTLVASLPMERLPIRKVLSEPMQFRYPDCACRWIRSIANNIPASYRTRPIITPRMSDYVHPNGIIINVDACTFSRDEPEQYPFTEADDGLIITLIDVHGFQIKIPSNLETSPGKIKACTPQEVRSVISKIIKL